ncbi:MAG: hypothetical protein M3Y87_00870 [Myxococcota bacterium]|nr:hypothetical protein [Myxococcota bacterium]
MTQLERAGDGEGFGVSTGMVDDQPCVIVDSGTLWDLLPDHEQQPAVTVLVFATVEVRAAYLREQRSALSRRGGG